MLWITRERNEMKFEPVERVKGRGQVTEAITPSTFHVRLPINQKKPHGIWNQYFRGAATSTNDHLSATLNLGPKGIEFTSHCSDEIEELVGRIDGWIERANGLTEEWIADGGTTWAESDQAATAERVENTQKELANL